MAHGLNYYGTLQLLAKDRKNYTQVHNQCTLQPSLGPYNFHQPKQGMSAIRSSRGHHEQPNRAGIVILEQIDSEVSARLKRVRDRLASLCIVSAITQIDRAFEHLPDNFHLQCS